MTTASNRMVRWGGARLSRRLAKTMPIIGAAVAVGTVVGTMRRKGVISGAFETACVRRAWPAAGPPEQDVGAFSVFATDRSANSEQRTAVPEHQSAPDEHPP